MFLNFYIIYIFDLHVYVFNWSNKYFVGTLVASSSTNTRLEVVPVYTSTGIAIYVINKNSAAVTFALTQSGRYALGAGSLYSITQKKERFEAEGEGERARQREGRGEEEERGGEGRGKERRTVERMNRGR